MVAPESFTSIDVYQALPWNNFQLDQAEPILEWCDQMGWQYMISGTRELIIDVEGEVRTLRPGEWIQLDAKRSIVSVIPAEIMATEFVWEPPTMIRISQGYASTYLWECMQSLRGCGESSDYFTDEVDVYDNARKHVRIKHMGWDA